MIKAFLALLSVVLLAICVYALFDIISGVWLVARYEHFDERNLSLIGGKLLFTTLCIGLFFLTIKAARKKS